MLIPSRLEPFGLVALQAAQMARPVVATRIGGLPEIVVHGETGLLVSPDDLEQIVEALSFLLSNPQARAQMGLRARVRAQTHFNFQDWVDS